MKRVTIYDVAKEAGVSLATVSRVINGSNVVKGPTKDSHPQEPAPDPTLRERLDCHGLPMAAFRCRTLNLLKIGINAYLRGIKNGYF